MSRIVLVGVGTRGDVEPLISLGVRMQEAGHDVALAAHALFDNVVERCGLPFIPLRNGLSAETIADFASRQEYQRAANTGGGHEAIGRGMLDALRDVPMDILLLTPLAEMAGHPLAEARGVPAVGIRPQPMSATRAHPPAGPYTLTFGPVGNRWASNLGAWVVDRQLRDHITRIRGELGLPDVPVRELRRRRTAAGWHILHGYSPLIVPRPTDWRPGLEVTGYWWPVRPVDWEPSAELLEFLDAGTAPVFVSFGSNSRDPEKTAELSTIVRTALRKAGVRGIVQAGWAGMDVAGDDVLRLDDVPYDWLFPKCAAVVHHGGAGTSSAALRAGIPAVAIPTSADQPFWASRYYDIGALAAVLKIKKLTADSLSAAITKALTDTQLHASVTQLAAGLAKEDGPTEVLRYVESILATRAPQAVTAD